MRNDFLLSSMSHEVTIVIDKIKVEVWTMHVRKKVLQDIKNKAEITFILPSCMS
jgi:hypothetical protein